MHTPPAILRFIARAALNIAGGGVLGDFAVDVLPDMAKDVWKWWNRGRPEDQLRAELQAIAQLSVAETKGHAELVSQEEGAGHPETVRQAVANYVALVPNAIRQSQRCRGDLSGRSLSSVISLRSADDLLLLLPSKMPRFRPGDRPRGIGDWELQELLGVGGFGEVWMACNPHLPHTVAALKFCTDATAAKVLRNEAVLLGRVMSEGKHQGIVKLLHTYLNAETPCLEYEYVAGGDLTKVIVQWHRAPSASTVEKATKLVGKLAEIVAYAHGLNPPIVHRDLKPANILLYRTEKGAYAPRIADFGIGGVVAGQALAAAHRGRVGCNLLSTALRGAHTPLYASPQQIDGKPPDPRDDVHALGVIWYQLLTGDMNIVSLPADWQDEVRSRGVSEDLLALLTSCLASRAEKRPGDAAELARRISEILAPTVHQPNLPPPTDSTHKRHQPSNDRNSQGGQTSPSGPALTDPRWNEWHYKRYGLLAPVPVGFGQLKQLAASGELEPTDLVWQHGMPEWVPANSVKGLFPAAVPCSAPAVQPVHAAPVPSWVESLKQVEDVRDSHTARQAIVQSGGDEESRRRDSAEEVDEALARLHRASWSIGETGGAHGWLVTGYNGENVIHAEGRTQAEAWYRATLQAGLCDEQSEIDETQAGAWYRATLQAAELPQKEGKPEALPKRPTSADYKQRASEAKAQSMQPDEEGFLPTRAFAEQSTFRNDHGDVDLPKVQAALLHRIQQHQQAGGTVEMQLYGRKPVPVTLVGALLRDSVGGTWGLTPLLFDNRSGLRFVPLQPIVQSGSDEESRRRDAALRPRWLREIIGQHAIVQRLSIVLNACKKLKEPLGHILLDGPPGLGKTTFANALASELGTSIQMTSGSALTKPADLLPFLTNVEEGSVLYIDEIHRMPRVVEELIYPAMKDFRIDVVLGEGMNAQTINLRLKPFTMIGTTTRSGMLSGPMRDHFKMHEYLEYYTVEELAEIVRVNARKLQTPISDDAALELAGRSRGTPRVANAHLWWARRFATSEADGSITLDVARAALDMAEVDREGLDKQDRRYLELLIDVHNGGPAGGESLAASMSLPVDTLSDEIEPYLLREQFIVRTRRGRMATARAYRVLGRPMKPAPVSEEEKAEAPSPPEEPVKDRPTDLFGNAIPTNLFGTEIGSKKRSKKG